MIVFAALGLVHTLIIYKGVVIIYYGGGGGLSNDIQHNIINSKRLEWRACCFIRLARFNCRQRFNILILLTPASNALITAVRL